MEREVDRVRRVIERYSPGVEDVEAEAHLWLEHGFEASDVEAWLRAGSGDRTIRLDERASHDALR